MTNTTTRTAPRRIYLVIDPDAIVDPDTGEVSGSDEGFPHGAEICWCEESQGGLGVEYMRLDLAGDETARAALAEAHKEIERLREVVRKRSDEADVADLEREKAEREGAIALVLLGRMRFACGDDGKRMQPELEQYLRELKRDADRYRWLRDPKTGDASPLLSCYCGDSLDSAIDAARAAEQSDERREG